MTRTVHPVRGAAWVVLGLSLAAEIVGYAVLIRHPDPHSAIHLLELATPLWVLAVVCLAVARPGPRVAALVVLGAAALLYAVAMTHAPTTSDDDFRYAWDAKVQLHGTDPYRYAPSAPQLAPLRDAALFGRPDHCQHAFPGGCTSINRPTVHTIYPPVAEAAFVVLRVLSGGGHGNHLPLQLAAALGALAVAWLLLRAGTARGRPWRAAVWAWCPVVVTEYANNAHIDWLAVLLVVIAFATPLVRRTGWAGALVGAAVAVKLYPGLVLPSLMRRRPIIAVTSALGVVAVSYVPHVLAVGSGVIGFLPGYLRQEDYGSGRRLLLLGKIMPTSAATVVGALIVAAVALWAWRRGDPEDPARSAVVVVGITFLVFTPAFGWYSGLLVALVALTGALEWLPVCIAATVLYLDHPGHPTLTYLAAALLVAVGAAVRALGRRRGTEPAEAAAPGR